MESPLRIPLLNRRREVVGHTLIDAADEEAVAPHRWFVRQNGYVGRTRDGLRVYLHRELLGLQPGDGLFVDHINHDRRDNRRGNLRVVTRAQQQQNLPGMPYRSSKYRGVRWNADTRGWSVQVKLNGKTASLGTFDDELYAARVAADYRREHMPHAVETLPPLAPHERPGPNRLRRRKSSRYKGVVRHKASGRWVAFGKVNGRQVHIGYFDDEAAAGEAAAGWRREHGQT